MCAALVLHISLQTKAVTASVKWTAGTRSHTAGQASNVGPGAGLSVHLQPRAGSVIT